MKLKAKCCKKFQKKGDTCSKCPVMAALDAKGLDCKKLTNKQLKKRLVKAKKRLDRAA